MSKGLEGDLLQRGITVEAGAPPTFHEGMPKVKNPDAATAAPAGDKTRNLAEEVGTTSRKKIALTTNTGAGGLLAWQNPESVSIVVERLFFDIITEATGAALVDAGVAANSTTSSDNLIDGADIGAAAAIFDNLEDGGTNGKMKQRMDANGGTNDWLTVSPSADPAGLVGFAYIEYIKL